MSQLRLCQFIKCIYVLHVGLKKDPGIPNLFPYKEQVLKTIQDKKELMEEEKKRQKEERKKEHAKRRSLQSLQHDAVKRTIEFERQVSYRMVEDIIIQLHSLWHHK